MGSAVPPRASGGRTQSGSEHPGQLPRYPGALAAVCQQARRARHRSHDHRGSDAVHRPQVPRPPGTRSPMQRRHPQPKARDHTIIGAVHRHALTGACGLVRRNTGDAVQEDCQDRDRVSRKGRDGRPPGPTGSAYASRRPRPCSAPVLVQQRCSRRRGGETDHRQPAAGSTIVCAATRQGKQVPDLSVVAGHRRRRCRGWSPTGARAMRSS